MADEIFNFIVNKIKKLKRDEKIRVLTRVEFLINKLIGEL
jgi:hypothetical protein